MKPLINKKSVITLVLCFAVSSMFHAQILGGLRLKENEAGPKGQFMIYGAFEYNKTQQSNSSSTFLGTSSNAGIPIGIGYFFNNNDIAGVNFSFAQHSLNGNVISRQNEAGIWYSPSVTLGKYFALIGQIDAHFVWGDNLSQTSSSMESFQGYRLRAYPLFAVFLGGGWALKFKFGELSMLQTKSASAGWSKNYIAGISGSTFGVGISKNIDFTHKKV